MKYSLRSLMIVVLVGPSLLAVAWTAGNTLSAWATDSGARVPLHTGNASNRYSQRGRIETWAQHGDAMKFTIRDLLLLTVVVALVVSWWLDHRRLSLETKYWETKLSYEKAMADSQKALGEYRSAWNENRERLEESRRAFELLTSPAPALNPPNPSP